MNLLIALFVISGLYGKIQGMVKDAQTGKPLPYVSVIILNTEYGALTDELGNFFILNIEPGRYTIKVSSVGYQAKIVENVIVKVDQVVRLNISLVEQPIELTPEIVSSKPPPVKKEMVAPTFHITKEEVFLVPVDYEFGLVAFQPSVARLDTAIHVRGGRANEVLYMIDNVPVVDPQTGDLGIIMSKSVLDEVIFLPGGFDVEYGRAMSGVINVVTARPSEKFAGKALAKTERIMPFWFDFGYENYQSNIHLPLSEKSRGYFSLDLMRTNDWDPKLYILPHKEREDYALYGKWLIGLSRKFKFAVSGTKSQSKFDRYNSQWKFRLDHYRSDIRNGDVEAINLNYLPGSKSMIGITLSRFYTEREYGVRQSEFKLLNSFMFRPADSLKWPFPSKDNPYGINHKYFYGTGDYPEYEKKSSQVLRSNLVMDAQVHRYHELKSGLDYSLLKLKNHTTVTISDTSFLTDDYIYYPSEYSAYLQDNIDYRGLFAKIGLRLDAYRTGIDTVTTKVSLSPRFGFSYMVTDRFLLRTNIGQYTQPPLYDQLFAGINFIPIRSYLMAPPPIGNLSLKPEKTRSFELGLQGQLRENTFLTVNIFYKDVTDLLGTRLVLASPKNYVTYFNIESANIKGFETIFDFKYSIFSGKVSYTLSYAKGTSSYAEEIYSLYYTETQDTIINPPAIDYYLDFDQRHRIFIQGLANLPLEIRMWVFGYLGQGFPYTPPGPEGKLEERNILRLPFQKQIDCLFSRPFNIGRLLLNANLEIINLLQVQNQIAPLVKTYADYEIQPQYFRVSYPIFSSVYHPAADLNHDGIISEREYYECFKAINDESEDYTNCFSPPIRFRIGFSVDF
ncbi:MAG: TonB-dependent receptor [candidate division WOR-3 bacterium]